MRAFDIVGYCIREQLFTCGDIDQYRRVQNAAEEGYKLHDIACMIWICSRTDKSISDIHNDLVKIEEAND